MTKPMKIKFYNTIHIIKFVAHNLFNSICMYVVFVHVTIHDCIRITHTQYAKKILISTRFFEIFSFVLHGTLIDPKRDVWYLEFKKLKILLLLHTRIFALIVRHELSLCVYRRSR